MAQYTVFSQKDHYGKLVEYFVADESDSMIVVARFPLFDCNRAPEHQMSLAIKVMDYLNELDHKVHEVVAGSEL